MFYLLLHSLGYDVEALGLIGEMQYNMAYSLYTLHELCLKDGRFL